jgi:hypothetical protein
MGSVAGGYGILMLSRAKLEVFCDSKGPGEFFKGYHFGL